MTTRSKNFTGHFILALCTVVATGLGGTGTITVRGVLLSQDRSIQPGARVIFSSNADPRKMIEFPTAASGTFVVSLMPGAGYNVRVMAPGYPLQYFDRGTPDLTADGPPPSPIIFNNNDSITIRYVMTPRKLSAAYGWIAGTVWDATGRPLAQIRIMGLAPGRDVTAEEVTDDQGRYVCLVPMQPHFVSASSFNFPVQFWGPAGTTPEPMSSGLLNIMANDTIRADMRLQTIGQPVTPQTPPITVFGGISGRAVIKSTNQPAVGVVVCAIRSDSLTVMGNYRLDPQYVYSPFSDTTRSDGSYTIAKMPGGSYFVFTRPQKYLTQFYNNADSIERATRVFVDTTMKPNIDFLVRTGGTISGNVMTKEGKFLGFAQVSCNSMKGSFSSQTQTDSSGIFLIMGLPAGTYCLNVNAGPFFSGQNTNQCNYTVAEGGALSGVSLKVELGGVVRGTFTAPALQDSMRNAGFEIALFPDSLTTSPGVLYENWTTWAAVNFANAGEFISSAIPVGRWRYVLRPQKGAAPASFSQPYIASRAYSFGNAAAFSAQTPMTIAGGDTVRLPTVNFSKGFSVFGTVSLEGGEKGVSCRITAYVKDAKGYVPVSRGYTTTDSSFELPGLIDGQEYFIGVEAPNYPMQFWSPLGSSIKPSNAYRFATTGFIRPAVRAVKSPQGYLNAPPSLSAWWVADSLGTGGFSVYCGAPAGMGIDTLVLYGKDVYGSLLTIVKFPVVSPQLTYFWKEPGTTAQPLQMYVFAGKGANVTVRSNIVWPDPFMGKNPAPGALLVSIVPMRSGVQVNWRSDSASTTGKGDTVIFYRKIGVDSAYARYSVSWGASGSFWDNSLEKAPAGATVYYKVEQWSNGSLKQAKETKFTVTQAFLDRLPKRLRVGIFELYKTVQQAVDAAADGDIISIGPGVYGENISLKGKAVSLEGDWQNGEPPVIDGNGGIAITVPYTSKSAGSGTMGVNGLKIVNALTGIAAQANVSVHQCLFVNLLREAVQCTADSAAVARAAATDPFAQFRIDQDFWQCTFVGKNIASAALRASSGAGAGITDSTGMYQGAMTPGGFVKVNNSIFANYASSSLPIDVKDNRFTVVLRNCDFWRTSMSLPSSRIKLEQPQFQLDPQFRDTVDYFLADGSPLSGIADNKSSIGYDSRGFMSSPDNPRNEPEIPPVKNFKAVVAGPHSISVTWSPLPDTAIFAGYMVFRLAGFDSLFAVNAQLQWEPKIAKDSLADWIDTFRTSTAFFLDTTVVAGKPYVYAVAGVAPNGNFGRIDMPGSKPFSEYVIRIEPSFKIDRISAATQGFTKVVLKWKPVSAAPTGPLYTVYRIPDLDSPAPGTDDSAAVRKLVLSVKQGLVKADVSTVNDTLFVDTSAVLGMKYVYVATVSDPIVPFEARPLTWAFVRLDSMQYSEQRAFKILGDRWYMTGPWGVGNIAFKDTTKFIYQWDDDKAVDKLYSQYAVSGTMQCGAGYWFKSLKDTVITVTPSMHRSVVQKRDSLFVKLRKGLTGWNQVSSPLPFPVHPSWLDNGAFAAYAWDGDSVQYTDQAVLRPWKGYWVHTDRDTLLPIRPSDVVSFENERALGKRVTQAQWELQVSLSGDGNDPDNFLGVIAPAVAKTRRLAYPKPPQTFDYAQLFIINSGSGKNAGAAREERLAKLYKSSAAIPVKKLEWAIGISPSSKTTKVRVRGVSDVPDKISLFWVSGATAYNLRENPEVMVQAHEGNAYAYIVATANPRDVGMYTKHFELRGCFPNPVRTNAAIEFTVPYSWNKDGSKKDGETRDCELGVYDMAGRCVATVFSGKIGVGEHRLMWRGGSDAGHVVAQGAYVIRLSGSDFQKTLKIMRLR